LELAAATPGGDAWRLFLARALALLGAGLLLAGAVCFVAYNWARVGRFGKFALIEAVIVAAALLAWRKLPRLTGQLALTAAAVLVGPLLAVFGQTYQTGADPYGLFLTWFAVIIPWVIAARFAGLWIIAIALLDVALILFWFQVLDGTRLSDVVFLPLVIAAIHTSALVAWEWQARRPRPWLDEVWAARVVAVTGFLALWIAGAVFIVESSRAGFPGIVGVLSLAGAIAIVYHYHRRVRHDRFMVAVAIGTGMALVTVAIGRILFNTLDLDVLGFLLMAAFVVWEITLGLSWFRGSRGSRPSAES
jgi:uncharacterized membrane protein